MTIAQAFQLALQHHQAGRLAAAEALYRQILAVEPRHAEALHYLGVIAYQAGQYEVAIEIILQAIAIDGEVGAYHSNLAKVLSDQGHLSEAVEALRRALEIAPDDAVLHFNLGVALTRQNQPGQAIDSFRAAVQFRPDYAAAYYNLGIALQATGETQQAIAAYRQAVQWEPDHADASNNLGNALTEIGELNHAVSVFLHACAVQPRHAAAHNNLGIAYFKQELFPEAIACYREAVAIQPDYAEAYYNLGIALTNRRRFDEAIVAYQAALALRPDDGKSATNLAGVFKEQGEMEGAIAAYRRAMALDPENPDASSNLLYTLHFYPGATAASVAVEHRRWQEKFAQPLQNFHRPHANDRAPERRLRIGYVSPDFSRHVICHFLTPLLEAHDPARCEVFCYASVQRPDLITERLQKTADVWRPVLGESDERLAEQIREDQIDVLVDLTQHMAGHRLLVFARRPAPVQVAWLGYPGTTGLPAMDYRLTDWLLEPEGAAWAESVEKAVRLPGSWFCFDPIDEYPAPGPLPALRLGQVTFGSLNNFCKINDGVLELWAEVLRAVEGSRLLLQCPAGATQTRVQAWFEAHGIAAHRLELIARTATRVEFLRLFERIDLALEPFPYNGGTTTCEALWMGIPVPTFPGTTAVSRLGLSILSAAGMPELIASSPAKYVHLIASLAADLPRLAALRSTLRARMKASAFMDAPRFARNVEQAYRAMWRQWCGQQRLR